MIAQLRQQLAVLQADQTTELSAKLAKQQVTHVNALPVTFHGCVGAIPLPLCILKRYLLLFCEKSLLLTVCLVWFGVVCVECGLVWLFVCPVDAQRLPRLAHLSYPCLL
jgi:hypothetical protein